MPFKNAIAITIDDNYLQHACVMLASLNANIKGGAHLYCIYSDLSKDSRKRIANELKNTRLLINFVEFNTTVLPHLPIKPDDHVSQSAFLRIWLPDLFKDLDQILFLDTDIVINGDITELLNQDVSGYPLAAVPDTGMSAQKKAGLGLSPDTLYFNSGVMVVNLAYFRQHHLTAEISRFITEHPDLCEFWDQDAFNAVIRGNFHVLDYRYNVQSGFYENHKNEPLVLKALEDPLIVHYTGGGYCKPWFYNNKHPLKQLYYKYLKLTSFKRFYPPDLPRSWRIFRKLRFRLRYK
jgi:lipopolysaccharide biosynthesis glycosyltransferase